MSSELEKEFYKRIPDLLSQTRVSFLIGAGCSRCAGLPMMKELTEQILELLDPEKTQDVTEKQAYRLLRQINERYTGIEAVSIEDFLSEIQDIYAILQRQIDKGINNPVHFINSEQYEIKHINMVLVRMKEHIARILGGNITSIDNHRRFCRGIHVVLKKGRERTIHPVNYFILNYDTLFEDALALEGISFTDGFTGGSTAWWSPSEYESKHNKGAKQYDAKVYKLHGSIDWKKPEGSKFPIRVRSTLPVSTIIGQGEPVVIYPASTKYVEAQYDPFSQMLGFLRQNLASIDNHILAIIGYGFNDNHINFEIREGIKASKGKLSVVVFLGPKQLPACLDSWTKDDEIKSQILILGRNAIWQNGECVENVKHDIEWYKFEKISEIVNGGA